MERTFLNVFQNRYWLQPIKDIDPTFLPRPFKSVLVWADRQTCTCKYVRHEPVVNPSNQSFIIKKLKLQLMKEAGPYIYYELFGIINLLIVLFVNKRIVQLLRISRINYRLGYITTLHIEH